MLGAVDAGLSGSTCANVMHRYGSDSALAPGIFADTPKRCGPVKKACFFGADPVISFTGPLPFGGTGMEKRKTGLFAETS